MATPIFGKGSLLQKEDSPGAGTYTTLGQVRNISGPTQQADEVETTSHDDSGDFRVFIRGLIDGGTVSAEINFDPADVKHQEMLSDLATGTGANWRIRWSQMTPVHRFTFPAFVQSFPLTNPTDAQLGATLTLRVTGAPVLDNE